MTKTDKKKAKTGKERRRHARVASPVLAVSLGGQTLETEDWSLGGFLAGGYTGELGAGSLLTIDAVGPAGGDMTPSEIRARVIRVGPETRQLAVTFLDVDEQGYAVLETLMAERMAQMKPSASD